LKPLVVASICVIVKVPTLALAPRITQLQLPFGTLPSRPDCVYAPLKTQRDWVTLFAFGSKSTDIWTAEEASCGLVCVTASSSNTRIGPLFTPPPQLVPCAVRPPR